MVQLLIVCLIAGVVLWGLTQFPIDPTIMKIVRVVVIVILAIYLIYAIAPLLGGLGPPTRLHR